MARKSVDPIVVGSALKRLLGGSPTAADLGLLSRHFLALLAERAPGRSVEVRVPPYGAVQCIPGVRHTRGNPAAVVECDPETWILLATGGLTWDEALDRGLRASGERSDLSPWLPLTPG